MYNRRYGLGIDKIYYMLANISRHVYTHFSVFAMKRYVRDNHDKVKFANTQTQRVVPYGTMNSLRLGGTDIRHKFNEGNMVLC